MYNNKFSFLGIFDLTRQYWQDIMDRKPLSHIVGGRKIRFITPDGKFDYTTFGHFYFPSQEKMMLITKDRAYTKYHHPDQLSNTLWSTVPVIFAGISTGIRDDKGREIYTGDIVTANNKGVTSVVRYQPYAQEPSLAGDNCDMMFSMCDEGLHKEGTTFCEMKKEMFECFDHQYVMWPTQQFYGNITKEDVLATAECTFDAPEFLDKLDINKGNAILYSEIEDEMNGNFMLSCLEGDCYEDENGDPEYEVFIDNFPDNYEGELLEIKLADGSNVLELSRKPFEDFILTAHRNPSTKYILCDFKESLNLSRKQQNEVAMLFYPLHEYHIMNVIVPAWMSICWITYDTLHYAND